MTTIIKYSMCNYNYAIMQICLVLANKGDI